MVEGAKVVGEALRSGAAVEGVYLGPGADPGILSAAEAAGVRVHALAPGVVERVAGTTTPQPELAVVAALDRPLASAAAATFVVVCVDVRDPGNLGTVLRSAEAAGAEAVVCCGGTVDLYNPKTVRASAGSLFHVPVIVGGEAVVVLEQLGDWGVRRLATTARASASYTEADLTGPVAIVLGNEAAGLDAAALAHTDDHVAIPMAGRSESLNVGMAAAVLCFEVARQRRAA